MQPGKGRPGSAKANPEKDLRTPVLDRVPHRRQRERDRSEGAFKILRFSGDESASDAHRQVALNDGVGVKLRSLECGGFLV
jgi:hypothetical protein